jgi:hypothetical protein
MFHPNATHSKDALLAKLKASSASHRKPKANPDGVSSPTSSFDARIAGNWCAFTVRGSRQMCGVHPRWSLGLADCCKPRVRRALEASERGRDTCSLGLLCADAGHLTWPATTAAATMNHRMLVPPISRSSELVVLSHTTAPRPASRQSPTFVQLRFCFGRPSCMASSLSCLPTPGAFLRHAPPSQSHCEATPPLSSRPSDRQYPKAWSLRRSASPCACETDRSAHARGLRAQSPRAAFACRPSWERA